MSGAYRPGADAPEDVAEVLTPPPSAVPEDGPARPRRSRSRRRRRPANPPDLADIADATGVRRSAGQAADSTTTEAPAETASAGSATAVPTDAEAPASVEASAAVESAGADTEGAAAETEVAAAAEDATESGVSTADSDVDDDAYDDEDDDLASSVRPYSWTRGRTRSSHDLQLETLVSTTDHGRDMAALTSIEHRAVAELCESARSVAEVAALLDLPLGVARVVVGDMAGLGLVSVHGGSSGDAPDTALMERVLSGLRRL